MFLLYLLHHDSPFQFSVLVPNLIGIGMNLLYLFKSCVILDSSKNSNESSAICKIISVPRRFSAGSNNSGLPSQIQCAAGSSLYDLVIISTFELP
jgi:hypothetical protein